MAFFTTINHNGDIQQTLKNRNELNYGLDLLNCLR